MSRHRNVRNLIAEDYDDGYDDDYYDGDDHDAYVAPPKQKQQPVQKLSSKAGHVKTAPLKSAASTRQSNNKADQSNTKNLKMQSTAPPGFSQLADKKTVSGQSPEPAQLPANLEPEPAEEGSVKMYGAPPPPVPAILQSNFNAEYKGKVPLTVVILGHVDAGKSTLTGHLLSKVQGQGSSTRQQANFAWLLDEDDQERKRGVTIEVAVKAIDTPRNFQIILNDAPGHADFVPAMILGTEAADAALLTVDATDLYTAMKSGQLREHAFLARGLGVQQVLVVVNKMDVIGWLEDTYLEIVREMKSFLSDTVGYSPRRIRFVPISGLKGTNLFEISPEEARTLLPWYKGPTLWEALDGFERPINRQAKLLEKPLRIVITDVAGDQGKGIAFRGRVVQGWVKSNESLIVLPVGDETKITKLVRFSSVESQPSVSAMAPERNRFGATGDLIDGTLNAVDSSRVSIGSILSRPDNRPPTSSKCTAKIWVLDGLSMPIIQGAQAIFHMHHVDVPAYFTTLIRSYQKDGASVARERPRALNSNTRALVELTLSAPINMETFPDCSALGRFVLRSGGATIAVGRIEHVY